MEDQKPIVPPVSDKVVVLDQLLMGITKENRHGEVDTGPMVGNEIW